MARNIAKWFDNNTNTYYERDLKTGKIIYVRKFTREDKK